MKATADDPQDRLARFASFARELSEAARRETLSRFTRDYVIEDKGSGPLHDPVTEADRAAELAMRRLIEQHCPGHGIRGEEFADRRADSRYSWSLDPLDGTRSYVCGLPTWTTLIALVEDDEPLLGLIDAPCLGETYIGCGGTTLLERGADREQLKTSNCTALDEARLSTTDPYLFQGAAADAFQRLRPAARTVRYGHDGYAYARLAAGTLDLVVECGLKPHDYDALIPVIRGAGGVFGDWRGGVDLSRGNVIAAATAELYEAAVMIMRDVE